MRFWKMIKDWMLPVAMVTGASVYLIYDALPEPMHKAGPVLDQTITIMQPALIFAMLFLTFCRIEPKELKPHRWHWWLLLVQGGIFTLLGLAAFFLQKFIPGTPLGWIVVLESAMLCMICPTATAAAVAVGHMRHSMALSTSTFQSPLPPGNSRSTSTAPMPSIVKSPFDT